MADEAAELEGELEPEQPVEDVIEDSQPQPESEDSQEETPAEPEKPKAKGVQKRLDELTALRRDAERDRDYWRQMAMDKTPEPEKPPEPVVAPTGKPEIDTFASYDEYVEALTDWKYDQRITADRAEQEAKAQAEVQAQNVQTFQGRAEAARENHPDFDAVVSNPSLPISEAMAEAAYGSEKGPELLYYLGTNPQEAARIHSLPPYVQAMELGKLEVTLSRPSRTQSGAPEPIAPVEGTGGNQSVDPDKMTTTEWRAWREKQLR